MHIGFWLKSAAVLCLALYSINAILTARLILANNLPAFALTQEEMLDAQQQGRIRTSAKSGLEDQTLRGSGTGEINVQEPTPEVPGKAGIVVSFDRSAKPSASGRAVLMYVFFAPLIRTSVPSIAYSALFPYRLPYYRLDLGFDILGFGRMPDDNLAVCDYLWPNQKGSIAVPFHFVLYSQGGVLVALLGAFLVGGFVSVCWYPISASERPSVLGSLLAAVVLTYAWLISIDSLRNNTLESYGMIWAVVLLAVLYRCGKKGGRPMVQGMAA